MAAAQPIDRDVGDRVVSTLHLAAQWGFAVEVDRLAGTLLGGPVEPQDVQDALAHHPDVHSAAGFATLKGWEFLIAKSITRRESHGLLNGSAMGIAEAYATELVRLCPWVRGVAVSGSVATGGFASGDDIDFDLVVEDETRYVTYLLGMALGAVISLRSRRVGAYPGMLRKLVCLNVIWTDSETRPFIRQDDAMAFELSLARPVIGAAEFARVVRDNPHLARAFPHMLNDGSAEIPRPRPGRMGQLLLSIVRTPRGRRAMDAAARVASWFAYQAYSVALGRAGRERRKFLARAKYPYEVFQDWPGVSGVQGGRATLPAGPPPSG